VTRREPPKPWQEDITDVVGELHEHPEDILIVKRRNLPSLLESYVHHETAAHLHFSAVSRGGITREYCAVVNHVLEQRDVGLSAIGVSNGDVGVSGYSRSDSEPTVLVNVVQLVQHPQRMKRVIKTLLPSVVRLQSLDECRDSIRDAVEPLHFMYLMRVPLAGVSDREHGLGAWKLSVPGGVGQNERVDDMVQGRPKIVNAITDQHSDDRRRVGHLGDDVVVASFRIELGESAAIVSYEAPDHSLSYLKVFVCSKHLFPSYDKLRIADLHR